MTPPEISYLLSFLAILVDRAGGELTIEHLSEYAGMAVDVGMRIDIDKDMVVLKTEKVKNERTN